MGRAVVASDANDASDQGSNLSLSPRHDDRGVAAARASAGRSPRPALSMMLTQGESAHPHRARPGGRAAAARTSSRRRTIRSPGSPSPGRPTARPSAWSTTRRRMTPRPTSGRGPAADRLGRHPGRAAVRPHDRRSGWSCPIPPHAGSSASPTPERYVDETGRLPGALRQPRRPGHGHLVRAARAAGRSGSMTPVLQTRGLTRRYGRTVAVAGVDLDVAQGEIFGLVGPNGAGKTTTMRMLATLLVPVGGRRPDPGSQRPPRARRGTPADRLHARHVRRLRRHARLGVPRLLRALPRHRRPGGASGSSTTCWSWSTWATSATPTWSSCRGACSNGCASPTRWSMSRRCCCSTNRPRGSIRGPGWSCGSCCASCARWARRSSSAPTSSRSSRSCAPRWPSSTTAACWRRGRVDEIQGRFRRGTVARASVLGDAEALAAAARWFAEQPEASARGDPARRSPGAGAPR